MDGVENQREIRPDLLFGKKARLNVTGTSPDGYLLSLANAQRRRLSCHNLKNLFQYFEYHCLTTY